MSNDVKYTSVEDFRTQYTCEEMVASFQQHINLSCSDDEDNVTMKVCVKED